MRPFLLGLFAQCNGHHDRQNDESRNALEKQFAAGEESARVAVVSSRSLAVRAMDLAVLLRNGAKNSPAVMKDPKYIAFKETIKD